MHVKTSMRQVDKSSLSEHEARRCRVVARGRYWEVWEEDILWWSPDRERWRPLEAGLLGRRRRWLTVETEEGIQASLIWDVEPVPQPPSPERRPEQLPERQRATPTSASRTG